MNNFDAVIIGGGPGGSTAATLPATPPASSHSYLIQKIRVLLGLFLTFTALHFIPSRPLLLVVLPLCWCGVFYPLTSGEIVSFALAALFFLFQNYVCLKAGVFEFRFKDVLLMPCYEPLLWGFWFLSMKRFLHNARQEEVVVDRKSVVGLVVTAAAFSFYSFDSHALFIATLCSTMFLFFLFHTKRDVQFGLFALGLGFLLEQFGVSTNLWSYPAPDFLGLPYWFATMWISVGVLGRRFLFPAAEGLAASLGRITVWEPRTPYAPSDLEERLKAFRKHNFFRSGLGLIGDWALIIGTLWIVHLIHHPLGYILGAYLLGIYQQRLGVLGHEAVHHTLAQNRRLNEWAGNLFCFWPLGISVLGYRRFHFAHHKYVNTRLDPEFIGKASGAWTIPTTWREMVFYTIKDLLALSWKEMAVTFRLTHPPTLRSSVGPTLMSVVFIGVSLWTKTMWLPLVWFGGLYTSSWAILRMRIWFEHVGAMDTHRVQFPLWARWIISPHNIWVHWEHHKYSSIPYWNLLKVRALEPNEPVLEFGTLFRQFLGEPAVPLPSSPVIVTGDPILTEKPFFIGRQRVEVGTLESDQAGRRKPVGPSNPSLFRLIQLLALEHFGRGTLKRQPEPSLVMDESQNVEAFDRVGQEDGPLIPLYHFNALGISRLLPKGGRLLDLGSGSGRLLAYLAQGRPDIKIIGLELSQPMVDAGNRLFKQLGLFPRVRLEKGDMTHFAHRHALTASPPIDVISINFALHHLPDFEAVQAFITQVKQLAVKLDCGFWLFDHSRPKTKAAAELFPEVFTPNAPPSFREDSRNSLIASWKYSELMPLFRSTLGDGVQGQLSRLLPYYLTFWLDPHRTSETGLWQGRVGPTGTAGQQFALFRALYFPEVPLDKPRQTPLPTPLPLEPHPAE